MPTLLWVVGGIALVYGLIYVYLAAALRRNFSA